MAQAATLHNAQTPPRTAVNRLARWWPVFPGLLYYLVFIARTQFSVGGQTYFCLFDDAMISMRYAQNLASGHGLVWNAGQSHVEGYTNFLWTLWMSLLHLTPVPQGELSALVMLSGIVSLVANLFVIRRIAEHLAPKSPLVVTLSLLFTAFYYPLIYWTLRGMEVGLIVLLLSSAVLLSLRLSKEFKTGTVALLGLVMALGILTRDDVVLPSAIVTVWTCLAVGREHRSKVALILGGSILLTVALHTAFRVAYYGEALPNTYHLKMEGVSTLTRVSRGILQFARTCINHLAAPIAVAVAYWILAKNRRPAGTTLLAALFLGQCAYSMYVGGDAWEWMQYANRYITIGVPSLLILAALGVQELVGEAKTQARTSRALAMIFGIFALAGLAGWWVSNRAGLSIDSAPTLYKLVERILPGKIATVTLALLVGLLLALPSMLRKDRSVAASSPKWAASLLGLLLLAAVSGEGIGKSSLRDACEVGDDAEMTRYALALHRFTTPDATIAVARAGALTYFSNRNTLDLLGKSDRVVAHSKPIREFYPGHNKQDLDYSLGRLKPDVVTELVDDPAKIVSYGYTQVAPTMFVRTNTPHVLTPELTQALKNGDAPRLVRTPPACLCED